MENIIGRKLDGRYEIKEIIGIGGMAVVYKAYDSIDDRTVAVKVLKDEYLSNDDFRRRFKNESKAVAVLSHPNIVKVYDVSFGDKIQYIVMEYIDGVTLKEYIDQQKVLTWKEAVHFTVQILRALQHAHEKGIVHRDIKPQNIMMLEDGTIKVTDFGIARFANSETRTMTDKAIGSVHYISPEQARGGRTDEKSDIYSVGVMMYEMLTGRLPFEADTAVSVAIMQMQKEPQHPRDINADIPEGLEEITLRAMQKDPANRYASAADMLSEIERFKNNPSIRFEYKYFVDDSPTRYVDAINDIKGQETQYFSREFTQPQDAPLEEAKEEAESAESLKDAGKAIKGEKDPKQIKKKKKSSALVILAGVAAALVVFAIGVTVFALAVRGAFSKTDEVTVPNLVGQNYDSAVSNSSNKIVNIQKQTTQYNSAPAGQIISQSPTSGTKVKKSSVVDVVVSLGPKTAVIPSDVYGKSKDDAETELQNLGFTNIQEKQQYSDSVATGSVISTDPAGGTSVSVDTPVTVIISLGKQPPAMYKVPTVTGETQAKAQSDLLAAGFKIGNITQQSSSSVASGNVISQNPAAGSSAAQGTAVDIVVSTGPAQSTPTVQIPNVIGSSLKDAISTLSNYGINVGSNIDYDSKSDKPNGTVIGIDNHKVGDSIPINSTIILQVSSASTSSVSPSGSSSTPKS